MTQINKEIVSDINQSLEISLTDSISLEELREKLSQHINHLINHDFEKLIYFLYRVDVNEKKMRNLLEKKKGDNTASLIADLIIERQLQKIESRKNSKKDDSISDDDRW